MQKVYTDVAQVQLIECISPKRNRWAVRWDVREEGEDVTSYMEEIIDHAPTVEDVRQIITAWIDEKTAKEIREGLQYQGHLVWLSMENQVNYQRDYSRAVATAGASLPVTVKLGTDETPVLVTFTTLEQITAFYEAVATHISSTQAAGWEYKAAIDWENYVTA